MLKMKCGMFTLVFILSISLLVFTVFLSFASDTSLEDAVLKGNWKEVIEILERVDEKASDPVARIIMAHACLATNRNNGSMLLFLSVQEENDLMLWSEWTNSLLRNNSQNPVALYLSADAKARTGRLEEALEGFTKALTIKEDFALALNARGVVNVLNNKWNEALIDLLQAAQHDPKLADVYANLGTYWVLKEAPEGAIEAFNQALTINPEFALVYNGRGCAYFGMGKYDVAIDDMEKAFELCPVLLPALSNQGIVLAVLASESTQEKTGTKSGTTLIAKSDLERIDYTSFTSADQMIQFHQSIDELGNKDPLSAVRTYSIQLSKIQNKIDDLSNKIEQRRGAIAGADKIQKDLGLFNQILAVGDKLMDAGKKVNIVPQPQEGWKKYYDLSRKVAPIPATPMIAVIKLGTDMMGKEAGLYRGFAESHIGIYSAELALRTRQYYDLKQEQGKFLSQAINQGVDFSKVDILGIGTVHISATTRGPIPEYSIPHQSPLTQFNVLPGAIGKDLAPPGKTPLVVIEGNTDVYRLGTMLRNFENRGVQTLSVPSNMDAQSFARMVGADRVVKITKESGSASWLPSTPLSGPKPGGVTQDMSHAHVDLGNWPVLTSFGLFYRTSPTYEKTEGGR